MFRIALSILLAVQALAYPMVCQMLDESCCGKEHRVASNVKHCCEGCEKSGSDSKVPPSDHPADQHHACFCTVALIGILPTATHAETAESTFTTAEFTIAFAAPVAQPQLRHANDNFLYGRVLLANICSLRI